MLINFCQRFLAGRLFFPLTITIAIALTASLILQCLVVAGCSSTSTTLRNMELLELSYDASSNAKFLSELLTTDNGTSGDFSKLRVGYRGICIKSTTNASDEASWSCSNSPDLDLGRDPLDVLGAAQIFKDHIASPFAHWLALMCIGLSLVSVGVHALPMVPSKEALRRVAAGAAAGGAVFSCGAMTLQTVTTNAVVKLVSTVSLGGIAVDVGNRAAVCGWVAFAAMVVATGCLGVLVAGDWGFRRAERMEQEMADKGLRKLSGGRVDLEAARGLQGGLERSDSGFAEQGKGRFPIKPETLETVASVAKKVHGVLKR